MIRYCLFAILVLLFSCETKTIKEYGLNDLVIGVQHFVIYENGEFYLELGLGGVNGKYTERNDTIFLKYNEKVDINWPDKILRTEKYFITIPKDSTIREIKIKRSLSDTFLFLNTVNTVKN